MSTSNLRPSSTTASNGATVTGGGGNAHTVLADDNNATYVQLVESTPGAGDAFVAGALTDFTLPAGAVIKGVRGVMLGFAFSASYAGYAVLNLTINGITTGVNVLVGASVQGFYFPVLTPPAGGWTDANMDAMTYSLAAYQFASGGLQAIEFTAQVIYVTKPSVTVNAPTGTITTNATPTTTWTSTLDADGGAQTQFQVKYFNSSQYGAGGFDPATSTAAHDSGTIVGAPGSASTYTPSSGLPNATYRAYVRAAQTVNGQAFWSDWSFSGFTLNTPKPSTPTATVTADNTNARIRLIAASGGTTVSTDAFQWTRSLDGGTTFATIRTDVDATSGITTRGTIYDYEVPNGGTAVYRVWAQHNYSGIYAASGTAGAGTASWTA